MHFVIGKPVTLREGAGLIFRAANAATGNGFAAAAGVGARFKEYSHITGAPMAVHDNTVLGNSGAAGALVKLEHIAGGAAKLHQAGIGLNGRQGADGYPASTHIIRSRQHILPIGIQAGAGYKIPVAEILKGIIGAITWGRILDRPGKDAMPGLGSVIYRGQGYFIIRTRNGGVRRSSFARGSR